jgi:hypothetical protein
MGSRATHVQVVSSPRVRDCLSLPLAMTSSPAGAVASKVNDALSLGWSFAGNQVAATSGWPTTMAPSSVAMKPDTPMTESPMGSGRRRR